MPWLLTSPGHQQPWYWLCSIGRFLSYLKRDFNCVVSMWRNDTKCKYMFMFLLKNLARKGLKKKKCGCRNASLSLSHRHLLGMPCFRRKLNKPSSWRSPLCTSPPSSWSPSTETSSSRPRAAPHPPRPPVPTPARPAARTGTARMEVSRGCGGMGDEDAGVAMVRVFRLWSWWWVSIEMEWGCRGCYGDGPHVEHIRAWDYGCWNEIAFLWISFHHLWSLLSL